MDELERLLASNPDPELNREDSVYSVYSVAKEEDLPLPFGSTAELPSFPAETLPPWLEAEVRALSEEYQVAVDLPAVAALSVLSTCCGGRARIAVRGSWREPLNLYCFVAQESGTRKSPVFAELTRPLLKGEKKLIEAAQARIAQQQADQEVARLQKAQAAKKAATGKEGAEAALAELQSLLAKETEPEPQPRIFADDVTVEALISLMAQQHGRMAVLSAEPGIFGIIAGRYSKDVNFEVFLKGYSGEEIWVDRKGRKPEYIEQATLTIGLCGQPVVLADIARIPGARGRGLLARVLYSLPAERRGYRRIITEPVPPEVSAAYSDNVQRLLVDMDKWREDPALLVLEPDALNLLIAELQQIEPKLRSDTGSLAGIADWASKLAGSTVRIAGLLHLAEHGSAGYSVPVAAATMKNAIAIGDYFRSHALAAFAMMNADPEIAKAKNLLRWLQRKHEEDPEFTAFSVRDMIVGVSRSVFRTVEELQQPLKLLEDHDYIRLKEAPERTGPGRRPSPRYDVNPGTFVADIGLAA